jgi:hypothetical protein
LSFGTAHRQRASSQPPSANPYAESACSTRSQNVSRRCRAVACMSRGSLTYRGTKVYRTALHDASTTRGNAADRSILRSSSRATRNMGSIFQGPSSAHTLVWCSSAGSVHLRHTFCIAGGKSDKRYSQYHAQTGRVEYAGLSKIEHGVTRVRLRGSPVRTLSKNFLATHQLDADCCTELPATLGWLYSRFHLGCR